MADLSIKCEVILDEMSITIKKVLLNTAIIILVSLAIATIVVFWFPGSLSFGTRVYGINTPYMTPINRVILLGIVLGIMAATYKIIRNNWQYLLIILSLAIILGHIVVLIFIYFIAAVGNCSPDMLPLE